MTTPLRGAIPVLAATLLLPVTTSGQEITRVTALPPAVSDQAEVLHNAPGTVRIEGEFFLPAGREIQADLAVLGGSVEIAGTIEGTLLVINGDLLLGPAARVTGAVVLIGGELEIGPGGQVEGGITVYEERLRYRKRDTDIVVEEGVDQPASGQLLSSSFGQARAWITVRAGTNYNRVEGLPVLFGPVVTTGGSNPFRAELLGIWRTNEGFSLDDGKLGYRVRVEQALGGVGDYALGASWHDEVTPIGTGGLTDLESSLATFFLHRDYRDYFAREGWSVYGRAAFPFSPAVLRVEYRDERHAFAPVGGPWSLTDNDGPWRPQPSVGGGDLQTLGAELTVDTRNSERRPTHGWLARIGVTYGLGGEIALPAHSAGPDHAGAPEFAPTPLEEQFTKGSVEVSWYSRLGPRSVLATRIRGEGSLDGGRLPPQYQTALGGEGTLPGYKLFSFDCGARANRVFVDHPDPEDDEDASVPSFLGYGCDQSVHAQLEFRSEFGGSIPFLGDGRFEGSDWLPPLDFTPGWTIFADFGRGWVVEDAGPALQSLGGTRARTDVGAGLLLGGLGVYWALPLEGDDRSPNFFIRFAHRF